ncbi:GNAT family N-acetyltransferase [Garciella nitratireducens]|uniref:Acetyltransferase (GNAT) domain-containing protein n=1 Tax=Garciella nitratireducens DSM 15102 TaxID=1121911 RepID=A0A1T4LHE8_9FIRM|nr:GNAT family N-acetyltransferase [Garciella nitratireducens]RBP46805.1 putative GNAT family N-acyltransferase [Garciella nitratireducens]SJZ54028.1 Acetyltransferase (GNAT) domain-containing protein [Garciella nitratireducens DSM 15102]
MYIQWIQFPQDLSPAHYIRTKVFIQEQNCPPEEEFDEIDKIAKHILLLDSNNTPMATARIFEDSTGQAIIGRVAVLKEYRKKGYGAIIVKEAIKQLKKEGYPNILIHAQSYASPFYQKLGFKAFGEEFMEAGIPHISMLYQCKK